jgi:hypothetical protein
MRYYVRNLAVAVLVMVLGAAIGILVVEKLAR